MPPGSRAVSDGSLLLPFAWLEVSLLAAGARELRVRASVERSGEGEALAQLELADGSGRAVARVGGLRLREASEARIREAARSAARHLYRLEWRPVALSAAGPEAMSTILIVGGDGELARRLGLDRVDSVAALVAGLDQGGAVPARVVFDHLAEPASSDGGFLAATHAVSERALSELQAILGEVRLTETSVAWLTSGAVATGPEEGVSGLSRAPLWGLVRSARAEHPDRQLQLLDVDAPNSEAALLARLLSTAAEPELALRHGAAVAPRLVRAEGGAGALRTPAGAEDYRVAVTHPGRLDGVSLVAASELLSAPLRPGQVRVSVRAAGVNFRDVLESLGIFEAVLQSGAEFAGEVEALGEGVASFAIGDRVLGIGIGCFATRVIIDERLLVRIPAKLSFEQAATIPTVFMTTLHALQDLGQVKAGERVLVHAAAGGVGMAAVQLCRHLGAEVYGTASAGKWPVLERMGLDATHIASSRDLSFEQRFLSVTDGEGVDVVLNSLTGEFVDASLRLLPRGGRFLEMGLTDLRDQGELAAEHRGVAYMPFELIDLANEKPDEVQRLLRQVVELFELGVLKPLPLSAYDLRHVSVRVEAHGEWAARWQASGAAAAPA
jgi:NADPH:quinone reductase-like Zn-dependent oxidoreductase